MPFIWQMFIFRNNSKYVLEIFPSPGWGPRPKPDMSRPKWTHEGGVVRSKLHGLETRMNAQLALWTHDGLVNARWSGHERTKVWTWTHEKFSCVHFQTFVRSCPDHRAVMSRPSCVHVQTIVRSPASSSTNLCYLIFLLFRSWLAPYSL